MKSAAVALTLACGANALSNEASTMLLEQRFDSFKIEHSKVYESQEEHAKRLEIFEQNVEQAASRNANAKANGHAEVHGVTRVSAG